VRSVKQECLSKLILFGEASLRRALNEFIEHYHAELNHQAGQRSAVLLPGESAAKVGLLPSLLPRTTRRIDQILRPRRMIILAIRPDKR
jgi:hypothetical protein